MHHPFLTREAAARLRPVAIARASSAWSTDQILCLTFVGSVLVLLFFML